MSYLKDIFEFRQKKTKNSGVGSQPMTLRPDQKHLGDQNHRRITAFYRHNSHSRCCKRLVTPPTHTIATFPLTVFVFKLRGQIAAADSSAGGKTKAALSLT